MFVLCNLWEGAGGLGSSSDPRRLPACPRAGGEWTGPWKSPREVRVRHPPARPLRRRVAAGMGMGRKAPVVNSVEVIGLWLSFPNNNNFTQKHVPTKMLTRTDKIYLRSSSSCSESFSFACCCVRF